MKIKVQVVVESESQEGELLKTISLVERGSLCPEELGLTLKEAKDLLKGIQQVMVKTQTEEYLEQQCLCPSCGGKRRRKGSHRIVFRSLFGKLRLRSPRLLHCECESQKPHSFSPLAKLLSERIAPELLYVESKFASLMSYGLSSKVPGELLPLGEAINAVTIRNHVHEIGTRIDNELGEERGSFVEGCPAIWNKLPQPEMPITVGIDGGYVHSCQQKSRNEGWFEVIAGKSIKDDGSSKCFAFVNHYDTKPRRRVYEILKSQGMQNNQLITFLSDGGDTVRDLQLFLNPEAEHLLDWFHITMRITVMKQMAKGLKTKEVPISTAEIEKELESMKWHLWHGNVYKALQKIGSLEMWLECDDDAPPGQRKLYKAVSEFEGYILANARFIPNYGDRYRHGEAISTGFVESTINQVVSKRFVKKQQMRWSPKGTHLLLQVRTKVLNEELRETFNDWYLGSEKNPEATEMAA